MRPEIFVQGKKIEKYFWSILLKTGHFAPIFAKTLPEAENAQDWMPGRLRPGQIFADQATTLLCMIIANLKYVHPARLLGPARLFSSIEYSQKQPAG